MNIAKHDVNDTLARIQQNLRAPKDKINSFGKYRYRSCESILEALKPLLGQSVLTLTDEPVEVGGRVYIKATATLALLGGSVSTSAFAREPESKKGMDPAQCSGATSSYARKYALSGLFLIDDNQDADAQPGEAAADSAPAPLPTVTSTQIDTIREHFDTLETPESDRLKAYRWAQPISPFPESPVDLSTESAEKLIGFLASKIERSAK